MPVDDEGGLQGHRARQVIDVGRGGHDGGVDFLDLLPGAVAADADRVAQRYVSRRDLGAQPEKAAEIDVALGLDRQMSVMPRTAHCAT